MELLPSRYAMRSRSQSKSIGQYNLGRMLRSIYGIHAVILEEFGIPEERLFIDFYMPHNKLAFEFQGEQHDEFNKFFHGDKTGFEKSKARDSRKKEWCELNDIILIEVRDTLSSDELKELIKSYREEE